MKKVMIMNLIGCSAATASAIMAALDWISYASLLLSLTGIGAAASAAVWSYRATILGMTRMGKRAAARAL
ncbi:hypothetical protein CN917_16045 [Bacillus thuringiensis]|uniref:Uncharacterized protein n=1 Tax=Bacillus cereus TaxID=1396 RepID=A0A9X9F6D3_BACCE|nr:MULTISPECIES: hypothetical protein [Bacillus]TKJ03981.1 hypothetical protein FC695_12695 [Bacillus cereus]MBJ9983077.1 hypothetical protein [Bacillus sp. S29]MBK0102872.1 hypothetical protein [Bacillus sp. S70]MBK0108185.1 hypothetical protein [Bacillus sp. S73]MBK0137360.1 hypothetical protein [Bacillus sp. S72]